jgi:hypothetical protein
MSYRRIRFPETAGCGAQHAVFDGEALGHPLIPAAPDD